jgi:hypothetical protein
MNGQSTKETCKIRNEMTKSWLNLDKKGVISFVK